MSSVTPCGGDAWSDPYAADRCGVTEPTCMTCEKADKCLGRHGYEWAAAAGIVLLSAPPR